MNNRRALLGSSFHIDIDPDTGYGMIDGHEVVDFELPSGTLWSTERVVIYRNPSYVYDGDDLFFQGAIYPWSYGYVNGGTPYNGDSTIIPEEYDAATQHWGPGWRLPTIEQVEELNEYTDVHGNIWMSASTGYQIDSKVTYYKSNGTSYKRYLRFYDTTFVYNGDYYGYDSSRTTVTMWTCNVGYSF